MTMLNNTENINEQIYTCELCGCIIEDHDDIVEMDGHIICSDCEDHAYICEHCGELTDDREYTCYESAEGDVVCSDCIDKFYTECEDCGSYYREGSYQLNTAYRHGVQVVVCDDCIDRNYIQCDDCGSLFHQDDIHYTDDGYYCDECYDENNDDSYIYDYGYKPEPVFFGEGDEDENLFMGVELEIDDGHDKYNCSRDLYDSPEIYLKSDGSLRTGFEIVSHPCTLAYHKGLWGDIINTAKEYGFKSHDARTCGLHVHMSRLYFGNDAITRNYNIGKVILLMNKHWDNMVKFSRRTKDQLGRWAGRIELEASKYETMASFDVKVKSKNGGRYVAVNLNNSATIELRIFNGTLRKESFFATLEFCQNLADAAKKWTISELNQSTFADIVNFNETEYLKEYCEYRGIDLASTGIDIIEKCHSRLGNNWEIKRGDLIHVSPDSHFARQYTSAYEYSGGWFRVTHVDPYEPWIEGVYAHAFYNTSSLAWGNKNGFRKYEIDMVVREDAQNRLKALEHLIEII